MTNTNVSLSHLRVLSAAVEKGSFSAAAEEIGITQSGVSQSIKHLEATLGVQLLIRHRDGVAPTKLGKAVLADARLALQAIERIRQACGAARGVPSGRIRLGSISSVAARMLPSILARFRKQYPGVTIDLIEGTDIEICEWVENAVVDLGLTGETGSKVQASPVVEDDFVLVVSCKHRLAGRRSVRLADIAEEPFLMSTSGCEPAIRRIFDAADINPPIAFRVRDPEALVNMVGQGLGVTIMPQLSIADRVRGIVCVSIQPRQERRIVAITKYDEPEMPAVEILKVMLMRSKNAR